MWSNFYAAGGYGMHLVSGLGFLLVIASALYALRGQQKHQRLVIALGVATFASGLLSTATGICLSAHYIRQVEQAKQFEIFALGVDESLHNVILSLMLVIVATLIVAVGTMRSPTRTPPAAAD